MSPENHIADNNLTTSNTKISKEYKKNKDNFTLNNNSDNDAVIEEGIHFAIIAVGAIQ
jgi:hypothetical protein